MESFADVSVQHTSASLTINENYDSDVRSDTETFLNNIVPEVSLLSASIICNSHLSKAFPFDPLFLSPTLSFGGLFAGYICSLEAYT